MRQSPRAERVKARRCPSGDQAGARSSTPASFVRRSGVCAVHELDVEAVVLAGASVPGEGDPRAVGRHGGIALVAGQRPSPAESASGRAERCRLRRRARNPAVRQPGERESRRRMEAPGLGRRGAGSGARPDGAGCGAPGRPARSTGSPDFRIVSMTRGRAASSAKARRSSPDRARQDVLGDERALPDVTEELLLGHDLARPAGHAHEDLHDLRLELEGRLRSHDAIQAGTNEAIPDAKVRRRGTHALDPRDRRSRATRRSSVFCPTASHPAGLQASNSPGSDEDRALSTPVFFGSGP